MSENGKCEVVAPEPRGIFVDAEISMKDVQDMAIAKARTMAAGQLKALNKTATSTRTAIKKAEEKLSKLCEKLAKDQFKETRKAIATKVGEFFDCKATSMVTSVPNSLSEDGSEFSAIIRVGFPRPKGSATGYHASDEETKFESSLARQVSVSVGEAGTTLVKEIESLGDKLDQTIQEITEVEQFVDRDIHHLKDEFTASVVAEKLKNADGGEAIIASAAAILGSDSIQSLVPDSLKAAMANGANIAIGTSEGDKDSESDASSE